MQVFHYLRFAELLVAIVAACHIVASTHIDGSNIICHRKNEKMTEALADGVFELLGTPISNKKRETKRLESATP